MSPLWWKGHSFPPQYHTQTPDLKSKQQVKEKQVETFYNKVLDWSKG
jgi:hypothetical protein